MTTSHLVVEYTPTKHRTADAAYPSSVVEEIHKHSARGYYLHTISTDTTGAASMVFTRH